MEFRGLAGAVSLLTAVVVLSGLVGRYIYTVVPRSIEGAEARRMLAVWRSIHVPMALVLFVMAFVHAGGAIYYATLLR